MGTGRDHGLELFEGLDAFRDDHRIEVAAQNDDRTDELEQPRADLEASDQAAVELHHAGIEVRDVLEVRVAGTEIVDDEMHAAIADLGQDALAQVEVRKRNALGDLEIQLVRVLEDRIVGLHEPLLVELRGMDVDEQLVVRHVLDRHLAQHATELAGARMLDGGREQAQRAIEVGRLRTSERFVSEDLVRPEIYDRLVDAANLSVIKNAANCLVGKGRSSRTHRRTEYRCSTTSGRGRLDFLVWRSWWLLVIGELLGSYRARLGAGGMGIVCLAEHRSLGSREPQDRAAVL